MCRYGSHREIARPQPQSGLSGVEGFRVGSEWASASAGHANLGSQPLVPVSADIVVYEA